MLDALYTNQKATRNRKVNEKLFKTLDEVSKELGIDVEIYSGGQPSSGKNRVGAHNHDDHGKGGGAADIIFKKDGKIIDLEKDKALKKQFVSKLKENGINEFGYGKGYNQGTTSMHVGNSMPNAKTRVWGSDKTSATADPEIAETVNGTIVKNKNQQIYNQPNIRTEYGVTAGLRTPDNNFASINAWRPSQIPQQNFKTLDTPPPTIMMDERQLPGATTTNQVPMAPLPPEDIQQFVPGTKIPYDTKSRMGTMDFTSKNGYLTPDSLATNGVDLINPTRDFAYTPTQSSEITTKNTGLGVSKKSSVDIGGVLGKVAPYISNIAAAFTKPGAVPRPFMYKPVALQRVNMDNYRNEIERGVRGNNLSFDQTMDAQGAAANKQFTLAQRFNQLSRVNQDERNQNIAIGNNEMLANNRIQSANNDKQYQFQVDNLTRNNLIKSNRLENLADVGNKFVAGQNLRAQQQLDLRKSEMENAKTDKTIGYLMETLNSSRTKSINDVDAVELEKRKRAGELVQKRFGGSLYSAGSFKRQTFKKIN